MTTADPTASRSTPVVLDTNVFVGAGFNPGSASAEMIDAICRGELRMAWSEATRAETRAVVEKIPPLRRSGAWDRFEGAFRDDERVEVTLDELRFADVPDPTDRKFAALAAEAGAILVSSDRHLLDHVPALPAPLELEVRPPGRWWRELA
jgi:predicted nucleic acid-binding protein